jgi:hypothetical protein
MKTLSACSAFVSLFANISFAQSQLPHIDGWNVHQKVNNQNGTSNKTTGLNTRLKSIATYKYDFSSASEYRADSTTFFYTASRGSSVDNRIVKYDSCVGTVDGETFISVQLFDADDNIVCRRDSTLSKGSFDTAVYSNGLPVLTINAKRNGASWDNTEKREFTYYPDKKIKSEQIYLWNGTGWVVNNLYEHTYNSNGLLYTTSVGGGLYTYFYDTNLRLDSCVYTSLGHPMLKQWFMYNSNGNMTHDYHYLWDSFAEVWGNTELNVFSYDNNNRISTHTMRSWSQVYLIYVNDYLFGNNWNNNDQLVKKTWRNWDGNTWARYPYTSDSVFHYESYAPLNTSEQREEVNTLVRVIYPVPAQDIVYIDNKGQNLVRAVEITDQLGRKCDIVFDNKKQQITTTLLSAGMYLLSLYHHRLTISKEQ